MTPEELLDLYDREVRGSFPDRLPAGWGYGRPPYGRRSLIE